MNFPKNSSEFDYNFQPKLSSSKNSITQDILKSIPSNQITINFSKDSNSSQTKKNPKKMKQKPYITKNKEEEKELNETEEEEINSDEYISSTMLDVDTDTYINSTDHIRDNQQKLYNSNKKNSNKMYNQGKLKSKENKNINENNKYMLLLNNIKSITDEKESSTNINTNNKNININKNTIKKTKEDKNNDINKKKIHHQNNKSDYFIANRPGSINKHKKNNSKNSNSIDQKAIFTPNNDSKKKLKILSDIIIKKLDNYHKNPFFNQSNTINIIENNDENKNNENKIKSINNDIINKNIKLDLDTSNKNKRNNKTSRITHNNSISILSNNFNKNIPEKPNHQNIQNNNNININIYNKNIIKEIGSINIDEQKFHLIPQSNKKVKTQGRVGKIEYTNQNKKNNFVCVNNYPTNINRNKTAVSPKNKKIRISPQPNYMHNMDNYNSICINKNKKSEENNSLKHNIHSLKNLKSENFQKNIKKYLLEDEYFTLFPLSNDKNIIEKQKIKILKDSKNKKFVKNKNNKYNKDDIKQNSNNFKFKKIIPLNTNTNTHMKQLRSVNSCYGKKINQNLLNNYQTEQILNTISNNHNNKKTDIYNNFKNNYNEFSLSKNINNSNKRLVDGKIKTRELSLNLIQNNNSLKNLLSLKKIKNLKNKLVLQSPDYYFENNREVNSQQLKVNKPITTRIKLDLMTEGNKNNLIKNNSKIFVPNNNDGSKTKNNNNSNSSAKRIIYIDNNNFKNFNSRPLIYNSLSPNCQSIKQLMNKAKISNIKEIYNNIKYNNQGRNTYNIYVSSRMHNNSNNFQSNGGSGNSSNKMFIKKIQKTKIKNNQNNNNITKTINYNSDNIYEFPNSNLSTQHKKIIVFNNVGNYNINSTNNTLNNITNIKEGQNNNLYKKTIEILSPFSSINNKNNNSHKKVFINKQNTHIDNRISSKDKKNNMGLFEQNILYLDNNKIKNVHTYTGTNSSNKYLYNKNNMHKLNKNDNFTNSNIHNNNSQYNYNIRLNNNHNNNIFFFNNSNDKDRNSIINKSYGNLYMNNKIKKVKSKEKNGTLDLIEKNQKNNNRKHISPIHEIKNIF